MGIRVTDLMVGDLVLHDGKVIRVDAVHKRKIGYHKRKDQLIWLFEGQCEPIRLTKEILEKNGFILDIYNSLILPKNNYATYIARVLWDCDCKNEIWCLAVEIRKGELTTIYHIHELQHLLKLCKIDKEIVV